MKKEIFFVGVDDKTLDLFEGQYPISNGISYNSYLLKGSKNILMDTVDKRKTEEWLKKVEEALDGELLDYLVISHLEPDHSASIQKLCEKYPEIKLIGNSKTFAMLPQFYRQNEENQKIIVEDQTVLEIGDRKLQFFLAPMVHWPEVMMTYEIEEKILFSADAFGTFDVAESKEKWEKEARRYYYNIVGKYGLPVQNLLGKLKEVPIQKIYPLHGPVLTENLVYYLEKYRIWSLSEPEKDGVLVVYNSIYGNTKKAVEELEKILKEEGIEDVVLRDITRQDSSEILAEAFYYDKMIVAATTYDGGIFPAIENFLRRLKSKNYQKRTVGLIENGSWGPVAGKCMKEILEQMKEIIICEQMVTIKTSYEELQKEQMHLLVQELKESK